MSEIIYILTNPVIPDLVKIGRTNNLEERVRSLSSHSGVPVPFEVYHACTVSDAVEAENKIQYAFGDHRINPKREFFRINPERVIAILQLIEVENVTPDDDFVDDPIEQQSLNKERNRRQNFNFNLLGIPVGAILHFVRDENITAKVVDDRRVEFEGEVTSLSQATIIILNRDFGWKASRAPARDFWVYENETLYERRLRLEEED